MTGNKIMMKKYITVLWVSALSVLLSLSLCACDFDESSGNLQGGDLLDSDRISEIKEEVLATEETTTAEITSDVTTGEEGSSDEKTNDTVQTEDTGTQSNSSSATDTDDTQSDANIGETVYWTESGGVWHLYRDCGHLKNSQNVLSGTVEEAEEAGKDHVCSTCNKKAGNE